MRVVQRRLIALTGLLAFVFSQVVCPVMAEDGGAPAPQPAVQTVSSGTQVLDASTLGNLAGLTVASGATAVLDLGAGALNFTGNFVNNGTVYVGTSVAGVSAVNLGANNIFNNQGALLTSILPSGGIAGFLSAVNNLSLNLTAIQDIVNAGTIASAGNLSMIAGGSVINSGAITAAQNLNITSMIGNIVNSGTMAALAGNLNIASAAAQNLVVNNINGVMQALNGSINVRDALFSGKSNLDIFGGDWLSKELNLHTGSGAINMNVRDLTGRLNIDAGIAHVMASTGKLNLGDITINGDPTFYNDAVNGDIEITGTITAGEALTLVASRNIFATANRIIQANNGTDGQDINLIAGANFTDFAGSASPQVAGTGTFGGGWVGTGTPATGDVTIDGPSATGGNIDFTGQTIAIDASGNGTGGNGGNVRLIAYRDSGLGLSGGHITMGSGSSINVRGAFNQDNGSVLVIAGANDGGAPITMGSILADGGVANTNSVTIANAQPQFTGNSTELTFGTNGLISSGNDFEASSSLGSGDLILNGAISSRGPVTVLGGTDSNITINANIVSDTSVTVTANGGGSITTPIVLTGTTITVGAGFGAEAPSFSPSGDRLYVPNNADDTVSVIDTASNTIIGSPIAVGDSPQASAVTPNGAFVYVVNANDGSVSVIQTSDNTVLTTITGAGTGEIKINLTGTTAYVVDQPNNQLVVIDIATNTISGTIPVGSSPIGLALTPDGNRAYVGANGTYQVTVIDLTTGSTITSINVGQAPRGLFMTPVGDRVFVVNELDNNVSVISTATNTVVDTIGVGDTPFGAFINQQGTTGYVGNILGQSLSVIRLADNTVVQTLTLGFNVNALAGTFVHNVGDGMKAYMPQDNTLRVIDLPTIIAPQIDLNTGTGNIQVNTNNDFSGLGVTANTVGDVFITEADSIKLGASSADLFQVGAYGTVSIAGAISANDIILQNTSYNGFMDINASITGNGAVALTTIGPLSNITQTAGIIQASNGALTINTTTLGSLSDAINLRSFANLTLACEVLGDTVDIRTINGGSGSITFLQNVTAATSVSVTADASGNITTPHNVINTVTAGSGPFATALNQSGTFAYVANLNDDTVSVIDTSTNTVVAIVPVGATPEAVVVLPAGTFAYVANNGDNTVSVIDTSNNTVVGSPISVGGTPRGMAVNAAGTFVYVVNEGTNDVSVIDTSNNTVVDTIPVGANPFGIAINPNGTFAYVANTNDNNVSVIDTSNNTVVATVGVGTTPVGVAVNPAGTFVYVANQGSDNVSVFDTATNTVVATVTAGDGATGVAVNPAGTLIYVANFNSSDVSVINAATNSVVDTVSVGTNPVSLGNFVSFVGNNATAYVANLTSNDVSVIRMPAIVAPSVTLASTSGNIDVGTNAGTAVGTGLTITSAGSATITEANAMRVLGAAVTNSLMIGSYGTLTAAGPIAATDIILQNGLNNGTMFFESNVTGSNTVTLSIGGNDTVIRQTSGTIEATAGALTINATTLGSLTDVINLRSGANLTLTCEVLGDTIDIRTIANSSAITFLQNVTAATSVSVTADGSGDITTPNTLVATIPVGNSPQGATVNPAGTFAYIPNADSDTVSVIDTSTNTVVGLPISVGNSPLSVAVTPNGAFAYVANLQGDTVSVIDTSDNTVVATIPVGDGPTVVTLNPSGTFAYVTNQAANSVTVIQTSDNTVVTTVPVGTLPTGVAVDPSGAFAYVTNAGSNTVTVIQTSNNTVVATVSVGSFPLAVAVNPAGTFAYVTNRTSDNVSVIRTSDNSVVDTITVGDAPIGVTFNPAGTLAYVVNSSDGNVSIINTATNTIAATVAVGSAPENFGNFVGFVGNNATAYVANLGSNNVSVIRMPAISAPNVTLATASGTINVGTNAGTGVGEGLTIFIAGAATITEASAVRILGAGVFDTLMIGSYGTLRVTGPVLSGNNIILQNGLNNGDMFVENDVTGSNNVTLSIGGNDTLIRQSAGTIEALNGTLEINVTKLGFGSDQINLRAGSNFSLNARVTGDTVDIRTINSGGSITLYKDVTGTSTVNLQTTGGGNITTAQSVTRTVGVGANPTAAAVSPDGTRAYIVNKASGTVTVIDTDDNSVIDTITVGLDPEFVGFTPDGAFAYVTNAGGNTITVIDTGNNSTTTVTDANLDLNAPQAIAFTPDGLFAYVTNRGNNTVSVIDVTNKTVVGSPIAGFAEPRGIAITPDGKFVYVGNAQIGGPNTVSVIEIATNTVVNDVAVGATPGAVVANPNGRFVYAANFNDSTVSIIDTNGDFVLNTVPTGNSPIDVGVNKQGTLFYVSDSDGHLQVFNAANNSMVDQVNLDTPHGNGAFIGNVGSHVVAYVPDFDNNSVAVTTMPNLEGNDINLSSDSGGSFNVATQLGTGALTVSTSGSAYVTAINAVNIGESNVDSDFLVGSTTSVTLSGALTTEDVFQNIIFQALGPVDTFVHIDGEIGQGLELASTLTLIANAEDGQVAIDAPVNVSVDGDINIIASAFVTSFGSTTATPGGAFNISSYHNLFLDGSGTLDTNGGFINVNGPDAVRLGQEINWTISSGSMNINTPALLGPVDGIAQFTFQDPGACVCIQAENFGSVRIGARTTDETTTISFDVGFLGISTDDGSELKIDANTTLINTGLIGIDSVDGMTLRNDGIIRSTGGLDPVTIGIGVLGNLGVAGVGQLDPGAGFAVGIFASNRLVLEDGVSQTVTSGDLLLDVINLRGEDNGTGTLAVTGGGSIMIGPECGCGANLTVRAETNGQNTTINLNAPTVSINVLEMDIRAGATLSTNGAYNIFIGDDTGTTYTLTLNGTLRQTGSGTLFVETAPSDDLFLTGTGTIRQDNATPGFTAIISDTQILLDDGLDWHIQSASGFTSSPLYIDTPVIGAVNILSTATITTDGGAISIAPDGGAGSIVLTGGTMNFNGGPLFVQAVNITVEPDTTVATDKYLGFIVTDDGDITNNGTVTATGTCAGCNGVNQFFLGFGDLDLFGTSGVFSPGTQGVAFVVQNGFQLSLAAGLNWTMTSGGLAFFQGSTVNFGAGSLFQATNNATIAVSSPAGSNLTVVLPEGATAELRNNGGIMGIVPQTSGTSIFFENSGILFPGLATLLLNTTSAAGAIYIGTFAPGSTNFNQLIDPVNIIGTPNPVIYFGTVNGLTRSITDTTAEPSLKPALGSPDEEDEDSATGGSAGGTASRKQADDDKDGDKEEGGLKPVAYIHGGAAPLEGMLTEKQVAADALLTGRVKLEGQALEALRSRGVSAWQEGEAIRLDAGSLLLAPSHDVVVKTPEGDVHVDAGSAVYMMASGNRVAIYNLHDEHGHAVRMEIAGQKLSVHAGRHLVLTRNHIDGFGQVNPVGKLGYRQVKEHKLPNGLRAFQGEFSLVSALRTIGGARELLASADSGHKDLSGRLMKTAAIQAYMTARAGAFAAAAAAAR